MTSAQSIGRVGGLAVALGVGAAIFLGSPAASADETSAAKASGSSSAQGHSARPAGAPKGYDGPRAVKRPQAVAVARSARPLGRAFDGREAAPVVWLTAAAARRELAAAGEPAAAPSAATVSVGGHEVTTTEIYTATGYTTHVAVVDTSSGTPVGDTLILDGRLVRDPVIAADGEHVLLASSQDFKYPQYTSQVAVLDTTTGTQTGTTLSFTGNLGDIQLVGTKGRAVVATYVHNQVTNTGTTQFTVIDANTGTEVGESVALEGNPWDTSMTSVDGVHALVMTTVLDQGNTPIGTNLAIVDTTDGTQSGTTLALQGRLTGDPVASADDVHVLVSTNDDPWGIRTDSHTQIVVVDATTGDQTGATLVLDGHTSLGPVVNADGIHAMFVAGYADSTQIVVVDTTTGEQTGAVTLDGWTGYTHVGADRAHVLVTAADEADLHTAVIDTATGQQISGATIAFAIPIGYTITDPDEAHVLFTTTDGDSTRVTVVDTATGLQTGTTVALAGAMTSAVTNAVTNADDGHVLIATTDGGSTHFAVVDGTTGQQIGATVTVAGELSSWEQPLIIADGSRVLVVVHEFVDSADTWTRVVTIDTVTGTQAGTTVTLPGWSFGPFASADGGRATIVTSVPASAKHGSSTHIAVIDTTTGNQVGTTIRLTGRPPGPSGVSAGGDHVIVKTMAGLRANVDTTTGKVAVTVTGPPWGLDIDAFALTPIGRVLEAVLGTVALIQTYAVGVIFLGALILGSIFSS